MATTLQDMLRAQEDYFKREGCYVEALELKEKDPIKYEIFHSRLFSTMMNAREAARAVSSSPMTEVGESCYALYTPEGDSITLSTGIMVHIHTMSRAIKWMIENDYEEKVGIKEGDFFANNDCFIGGVHTPDVMLITPIFYQGELVGWAGGVTHLLETGATEPGGEGQGVVTRFHEGKFLCCSKIAENDEPKRDYEIQIERGVRSPSFWLLDDRSKIAGCRLVRDSIKQIIETFGVEYYRKASRELIEEARRGIMAKVRQMLVPGRYKAAHFFDNPMEGQPLPPKAAKNTLIHEPVEVTITPEGKIIVDLEGANGWGIHPYNATPAALDGGFFVCLTQFLAYDGKINDGAWLANELKIPYKSWANPDSIFAGTCFTWGTLMSTFSAFISCLARGFYAKGYREEIMAGTAQTPVWLTGGTNQYGKPFGTPNSELVAGGSGARGLLDGIDTAYALWNPAADMGNIEIWELVIPQMYLGRSIIPDSGGFGKYRGGNGFESLFMVYHTEDIEMGGLTNGSKVFDHSGLMGGYPGMCNYHHIARKTNVKELIEQQKPLPHGEGIDPSNPMMKQLVKSENLEVGTLGGYACQPNYPYDLYEHFYVGGPGYGDPIERDPDSVKKDLEAGVCTFFTAKSVFCIEVDSETLAVDYEKTRVMRDEMRQKRKKRGIPASGYLKKERERILKGKFSQVVKEMYNDSFRLSPKFAGEYRKFWNLPDDFETFK